MTIDAATLADKLEAHNRWRRGDEAEPSPDPAALGVTIDEAVNALRELSARVAELEAEDASRKLHRDLLRRVAIALKGPEDGLVTHGWSDLPEVAEKLRNEVDILRTMQNVKGYNQ